MSDGHPEVSKCVLCVVIIVVNKALTKSPKLCDVSVFKKRQKINTKKSGFFCIFCDIITLKELCVCINDELCFSWDDERDINKCISHIVYDFKYICIMFLWNISNEDGRLYVSACFKAMNDV